MSQAILERWVEALNRDYLFFKEVGVLFSNLTVIYGDKGIGTGPPRTILFLFLPLPECWKDYSYGRGDFFKAKILLRFKTLTSIPIFLLLGYF